MPHSLTLLIIWKLRGNRRKPSNMSVHVLRESEYIHLLSCLVSFFYSIKFIVLELYCPWKWDKASPPPLTFKGKIKCSIFILSFWDLVQPGRIQNSKNNILSWMQSRARFSCITIDFANFLLTTFPNLILQIQLCLELYRKTIHAINTK